MATTAIPYHNGIVVSWNSEKAYGFVQASDGSNWFIHISGVADRKALQVGDTVVFDAGQDKFGRSVAVNLRRVDAAAPQQQINTEADDDCKYNR
jgi:cold shock CspA family protein